MASRFNNQIVWVTGASSGIGEAMARDFVKRGARVILTARREDRLAQLATELNAGDSSQSKARVLAADLANLSGLTQLASSAIQIFGGVDVLVNNAGVSQRGLVIDTPFEVETRLIQIGLLSPIALTKALLPHLTTRKNASIIVTSSLMGELELPGNATYAAVKHGLNGYFYSLAYEMRPLGVRVQVIEPGFVKTEVSLAAITSDGSPNGKMEDTHKNAMTSEEFSRRTFPKLERGQVAFMIADWEKWVVYIRRWFPGLYRFVINQKTPSLLKERTPYKL